MNAFASENAPPLLWVVTDQLPYPPRNGITLPIFRYIEGLKNSHVVRLVLLVDIERPPSSIALAENEQRCGPIYQIRLQRRKPVRRLMGELLRTEMYQHGWDALQNPWNELTGQPNCILVSPMSAVAKWRSCGGQERMRHCVHLAAVNDCTAAEYYYRNQGLVSDWKLKLKRSLDRARTPLIGSIEGKLLMAYQTVFLQTEVDRQLMGRLVSPSVATKVTLAPNGVDKSLFAVKPLNRKCLVFVGELSGEYASTVHWLVNEVWPEISHRFSELELIIVGGGASASLKELMNNANRVVHMEYVPNLAAVYATALIAISPVFKGFGLINKTLEAMACAIPVVGGAAAFNGIQGFQDQQHGIVCPTSAAKVFAEALRALLVDKENSARIGLAARALIANQFSWDTTVERVRSKMVLVKEHHE